MHEAELLLDVVRHGGVSLPAGRERRDSVQLLREAVSDDPARAAELVATDGGVQIAYECGAVESEQLVAVGGASLISDQSVLDLGGRRRLGLDGLSVLLEAGDYFGGVVDLEYAVDGGGGGLLLRPAHLEDDPDDVLAVDELGDGVFGGLVVLQG